MMGLKTHKTAGQPAKYATPEALDKAIKAYFDDPKLTVPTTAGLALHLGYCDRNSLYDNSERSPEFSRTIKSAILRIMKYHEEKLSSGDKCTGSIFWLKNHDWHDRQEFQHSGDIEITLSMSTEGI